MPEDTIFADQQVSQEASPTPTENPTTEDLLGGIKNADGNQKYQTVDAALSSLATSQEHIVKLESENSQYRENETKAATMDDLLTELRQQPNTVATPQPVGMSADELQGMTFETIRRYESQKLAEANAATVDAAMRKQYGDKAKEVFSSKAKELGVDINFMYDLAKRSPTGFMAQFKETSTGSPTIETTTNALSMSENQTSGETKAPENLGYGADSKDVTAYWNKLKEDILKQNS